MTEKKSFFQDLWDRRFFQFGATYLGGAWVIIQVLDWAVNRYGLANHWVDMSLLFLLMSLPAYLVFIYNHGRPGPDKWLPFEKVFIPFNIVVAFGLSFFIIDVSAKTSEEIIIQDENGKEVIRTVPKVEYSNRIAIMPTKNSTEDPDFDWIKLGLPYLLDFDLEQDMRLISINPVSFDDDYNNLNLNYLEDLSFSNSLKIARDVYSNYFINSEIKQDSNSYTLELQVYESATGKLFYENSFQSADLFELVDQVSQDFTDNLYLDEFEGNEEYIDVPSEDLISSNIDALKAYIQGWIVKKKNGSDLITYQNYYKKAVELDNRCAECYSSLSMSLRTSLESDAADEAMKNAVKFGSTLPERQRLNIQKYYFFLNLEVDKGVQLLHNWAKLYPNDFKPYDDLIEYYTQSLQYDKAKSIAHTALANGHKAKVLLSLAKLYTSTAEYEDAQKYMLQYIEAYPEKSKKVAPLADLYIKQAKFDEAEDLLSRIYLTHNNDLTTILKLADLETKKADFNAAEKYFDEALSKSFSIVDSIQVLDSKAKFYQHIGQISKSISTQDQVNVMNDKIRPAVQNHVLKTMTGARYSMINKNDVYKEIVESDLDRLNLRGGFMEDLTYYLLYVYIRDKDNFKKYADKVRPILVQNNGPHINYSIDGGIAYLDEDYLTAGNSFEQFIDSTGTKEDALQISMVESFRKAGELDKAEEKLSGVLERDPNNPSYLLQKAHILKARGESEKTKETIDKVLDYWKDADPEYTSYIEAKEIEESLKVDQ